MRTGLKKTKPQLCQEQVDTRAQFLMQDMLNGVLQQLERIERVVEGVQRSQEMERSQEGDRNHVTAEDNFQALKTKLTAFSIMQNRYRGSFSESANDCLCEWIARRPNVKCSPHFIKAVADTQAACKGKYSPFAEPVKLTEEMLKMYAQQLAKASHDWHYKEAKFNKDPEAAISKQEQYKILPNAKSKYIAQEFMEKLTDCVTESPTEEATKYFLVRTKTDEARLSETCVPKAERCAYFSFI